MYDFSRHLPVIGREGQERLARATVAVVGAGALGSYMTHFLHRVGVGKIIVVDRDIVEEEDLPRTMYREEHVGMPKAEALSRIIGEALDAHVEDLNPSTLDLLEGAEVVLDGTDNLLSRYVINDYCVREGKPWVHAGVVGTGGTVMPVLPGRTACFRCYLPAPPSTPLPTCATSGIMSYVPPVAAALAVAACMNILLGREVGGRAIFFDLGRLEFHSVEVPRREDCPCCARHQYEFLESSMKVEEMCDGTVQVVPPGRVRVDIRAMAERLKSAGKDIMSTDHYIRFRDGHMIITIFTTGRMLIKGARNTGDAKNLYARYMG